MIRELPKLPRVFVVALAGEAVEFSERDWERHVGLSPDMSFATDILFDAGMLDAKRLRLLQACESQGRNPADFARHLVRLNRALRRP